MQRAPKNKLKNKIDGWLNLEKPLGMSSAQAVGAVKRILRPQKIGHAGTLDPLASGVLPLALGEATKTVRFMQGAAKEYIIEIKWGETTSTDDAEGEVLATSDITPALGDIEAALPSFLGEIEQTPPAYSAIKKDGKRAYARARAGEVVELAARKVRVDRLEILDYQPSSLRLEVACGKGTYMRSLGRDLAAALGICGHISYLRRTKVGIFDEKSIITLDMLDEMGYSTASGSDFAPHILPISAVLGGIPSVYLANEMAIKLQHGQACLIDSELVSGSLKNDEPICVYVGETNGLIAICILDEAGRLIPQRVFGTEIEGRDERK